MIGPQMPSAKQCWPFSNDRYTLPNPPSAFATQPAGPPERSLAEPGEVVSDAIRGRAACELRQPTGFPRFYFAQTGITHLGGENIPKQLSETLILLLKTESDNVCR